MIIVTGAAGFIGSCLVSKLNKEGITDILVVDDFSKHEKDANLENKKFTAKQERSTFIEWLKNTNEKVECIFHIGARTDTTEFNKSVFDDLNVNYTQSLWEICAKKNIPFLYASSAATYGLGEFGYDDKDESIIPKLKPLNPYGDSKNDFDIWALKQTAAPQQWAGFKFFNVYGPNEFHKARMASVIFHSFNQINAQGFVKLFRSHNPNYTDGGQLRDFVYVKDLVDVLYFAYTQKIKNGIYNLGSGTARTFLDLAKATFKALDKEAKIDFIDTPIDIRDKYQYFTEAKMEKLREVGYTKPFHTLEEGVEDYVQNYLVGKRYY
ncbi:MAG: ADP-glyceromanno-heptose 6-epimerase [Bacteroidota bacterium]|nr:ADP-glyceromanno-heptose 6-epimerase [Bacteroidota bacterium]